MLTQKTSGPSVLQTGRVLFLPLGAIRPNPAQPRSVFDAAGLQGACRLHPAVWRAAAALGAQKGQRL